MNLSERTTFTRHSNFQPRDYDRLWAIYKPVSHKRLCAHFYKYSNHTVFNCLGFPHNCISQWEDIKTKQEHLSRVLEASISEEVSTMTANAISNWEMG